MSGMATKSSTTCDACAEPLTLRTDASTSEGVLRDAVETLDHPSLAAALDAALRHGASRDGAVTVVNANRQRPTADRLWPQLLDYLTREELWAGCRDCPFDAGGCPMRSNAEQRRVYWVTMPVARRAAVTHDFQLINQDIVAAAGQVPGVTVVDIVGRLSNSGQYADYLPDDSGRQVLVRARDGVHLSEAGARIAAGLVLHALDADWHVVNSGSSLHRVGHEG
jgi:hypothetical protein